MKRACMFWIILALITTSACPALSQSCPKEDWIKDGFYGKIHHFKAYNFFYCKSVSKQKTEITRKTIRKGFIIGWKRRYYRKFKFPSYGSISKQNDEIIRMTIGEEFTDWGRRYYNDLKLPSENISKMVQVIEINPKTGNYRIVVQCYYDLSGTEISRKISNYAMWQYAEPNTIGARCVELAKKLSEK